MSRPSTFARASAIAALVASLAWCACAPRDPHGFQRAEAPERTQPAEPATSEVANRGFFRTAKPYTRWWWFASEIDKKDIEHQLNWLKENNFGGVEVAWVYPMSIPRYARFYPHITDEDRKERTPRQEWLSPEWSEVVAHAKKHADGIGLGMDFTFGSAWPFGDSQVPPEDAARLFGNPHEQRVKIAWEYPEQGLVIDHLDAGAFERYARRMGKALEPALAGSRSGIFVDSWEVDTRGIWTDGFGEEFQRRYGYAIEPFMPELYAEKNAGPRYDYMKLVSELVLKNFYEPFTRKAHELGAFSRAQCAGAPTDILSAYAAVDVPETEALLYEPGYARIVASAAALGSRRDVSCETFTCLYGFPRVHMKEEQTADLKLVADAVFANGVNHVVWHGTPFNGPGPETNAFYASVHVGSTSALAPELAEFNAYMEKVQTVMKQGVAYSDVAAYLPLEDSWVAGEYPEELQLKWSWGAYELRYVEFADEIAGYQPLWINHAFLQRGTLRDGRLHVGDASFSALHIDVDYMDVEALTTVLELARQGFPVCLVKPPGEPGKRKTPDHARMVAELTALENVSADWETVAVSKPLVTGQDLPDYFARVVGDELFIFFAHPRAQDLHLPLDYGQSFVAHDIEREVDVTVRGKTNTVSLVFEPYQSLMLKVDASGALNFVDITFVPRTPKVEEAR